MPKVDDDTGLPLSDDPDSGIDELRGGKKIGDPALDDASANGERQTKKGKDYAESSLLPAERSSGK